MTTPLSPQQVYHIQKRLPPFELSYETIAHKKVFDAYQICLAIPTGKKSFAWFSFHNDQDVCYFMELNREKKISHITIANGTFDPSLSLGTLLYGTIVLQEGKCEGEEASCFVVEDIYYYKGLSLKQQTMSEKFGYLEQFFTLLGRTSSSLRFFLPFLWGVKSPVENDLIQELEIHRDRIPYPVHHLQVRKLTELSPYLNIQLYLRRFDNGRTTEVVIQSKASDPFKKTEINRPLSTLLPVKKDFNKPQYRYPTVFWVSADIQYDIYHLFAYDNTKQENGSQGMVYYDIAYIQNIKVSKMMNGLFRKIRENDNLDYIEESDDEDDFENMAADKYVDLHKKIPMEFLFNRKFKKWVPIRLVETDSKIIHINRLSNDWK